MKQSSYHLTLAFVFGLHAAACAAWGAFAMLAANSIFAIPLGLGAVFLIRCTRIQLHDRRIAIIREDWRRESKPSTDWQFENIVGPKL